MISKILSRYMQIGTIIFANFLKFSIINFIGRPAAKSG